MSDSTGAPKIIVIPEAEAAARAREILDGLASYPKRFPMKYLYTGAVDDERLFEAIASMPDYHVAEAEERLLRRHIEHLVQALQPSELLDVGCGCGLRVDVVLEAMREAGGMTRYVGLDIAGHELERWLGMLSQRYPELEIRGVVGDFERQETLAALPRARGQRLAVILGQTLGNFSRPARVSMLRRLWGALDPGDPLIVGLDFTQDLEAALPGYDDPDGRNAAFSLNALDEMNRLLGCDLQRADFHFRVHADHAERAIISSLVARRSRKIINPLTGKPIEFRAGEPMFTERSHRFDAEGLRSDFNAAGFDLLTILLDQPTGYGLAVAVPRPALQDRIYGLVVTGEAAPVPA